MNSEKNLKKQRKAFYELVKNQVFIATSNPFCGNTVSITLPQINGMNSENIKPTLQRVLGYTPNIVLYQIIETEGYKAVLVVFELK